MFRIKARDSGKVLYEGEGENLREVLEKAVRAGVNLSRANLSGGDLSKAYLSGANLSGADLSKAYLSGACLSGANLTGVNLSGAYL